MVSELRDEKLDRTPSAWPAWTADEKARARGNIDAASAQDVDGLKGDLDYTRKQVSIINGGIFASDVAKMEKAWTEYKAIEGINLESGATYKIAITSDTGVGSRYFALCDADKKTLIAYNKVEDGEVIYTATEDKNGCYLDCRTSADGIGSNMYVSITLVSPTLFENIEENMSYLKGLNMLAKSVDSEKKTGMHIYNGTLMETANGTYLELEAKKGDKYKITATTKGGYYVVQPNYKNNFSNYIRNGSNVNENTSNNTSYLDYDIEIISDCTLIINCTNGFDFIVKKYDIFATQEIVEYVENLKTESVEESKTYTDEAIRSVTTEMPEINIGSKLFAVVGDTLQIFKKSIFNVPSDGFVFEISCPKGKVYPRYFEYTPTASDVGTSVITFNIYKKSGEKVATKTVSLVTVNANNPSSQVNVMNIGDSTTYSGQTPIELSRRLKGTNGVATSPEPLALSNVNVNGRLKNADKSCGWEGTGGWTYSTYNGAGVTAVRFTVTNASNISVGDIIQINATNSKGYYRFQVEEVNVTSGSGELRCMFYQTPYTSTFLDEVSASGLLNNTSSSTVGTYSSLSVETYQPFWNNETDSFDITSYVNAYLDGHCEYIFILLGINNLIGMNPFNDVTNIFNDCKTLLNNIHSQLPNTKILLSTNPLISQNGGVGANYNANTNSGSFDENGWNHKIWSMNELYYTLESDDAYKDWVTVINTHAQFDSEYGYPYGQYPVNIRMNNVKENRGTNAVHPLNEGYWMIADAEFRALLGLLS